MVINTNIYIFCDDKILSRTKAISYSQLEKKETNKKVKFNAY